MNKYNDYHDKTVYQIEEEQKQNEMDDRILKEVCVFLAMLYFSSLLGAAFGIISTYFNL